MSSFISFTSTIVNIFIDASSKFQQIISSNQAITAAATFISSPSFLLFLTIQLFSLSCFIGYPFEELEVDVYDESESEEHKQCSQPSESKLAKYKKRPSFLDSIEDSLGPIKSPRLMAIAHSSQITNNLTKLSEKRRNSAPATLGSKFQLFTIQVNLEERKLNHERIALLDDGEDQTNLKPADIIQDDKIAIAADLKEEALLQQKEFPSDAYEWFMRWNLTEDELGQLHYAQKARRYYILSTYGEPIIQNPEPPEDKTDDGQKELFEEPPRINEIHEDDLGHLTDSQKSRFYLVLSGIEKNSPDEPNNFDPDDYDFDGFEPNDCNPYGYKQIFAPPEVNNFTLPKVEPYKFKPPLKPMNILSELVDAANKIDVPVQQIYLLRMNHDLLLSYTKNVVHDFYMDKKLTTYFTIPSTMT